MTRRALVPIAVLFVLGTAADLLIGYSPFPGYGAAIGLFGCIAIVIISKWLGEVLLNRPESYYPGERPPDLQPDLLPPTHPEHQPHQRRGRA
ncbi:MAG: hypothetical protein ACNA8R_13545 [Nitriliruptoraceae bacterium]